MKGELFINALDAYTTWGVTLGEQALTALLTPPAVKPQVENKSRATHGKEILDSTPKLDSRELTLEVNMVAPSRQIFLERYSAFCLLLSAGELKIETKYTPGIVYRCRYISCQQFTCYNGEIARFALRIEEPNPNNR